MLAGVLGSAPRGAASRTQNAAAGQSIATQSREPQDRGSLPLGAAGTRAGHRTAAAAAPTHGRHVVLPALEEHHCPLIRPNLAGRHTSRRVAATKRMSMSTGDAQSPAAAALLQLAAQRLAAELEVQTAELLAAFPPKTQAKQPRTQPQQPQPQQQAQQPPQQPPPPGKKEKLAKKCRDWGKCRKQNCKFRHPENWAPPGKPKSGEQLGQRPDPKVTKRAPADKPAQQQNQQQPQQQQEGKKNKKNKKKEPADPTPQTEIEDCAVPRQGKYWWRKLKGTDPITLERLR